MSTPVRTRFAPSPTGLLHVGGVRTALFAWLLARQNKGAFILRLEDTDQKREVSGADQHIMDCLHALGLEYDEGPDNGGAFGPYRQHERLAIYQKWAKQLVEAGRAYADPYSPAEVQSFREAAQTAHKPFLYREHRPEQPPVWDGTQPLRFKSDPKPYKWHDAVMGDLSTSPEVIDDFVLLKSDGYPTYNFAHVVDDAEMQVSHVIRGQEFLASQPNYLNLYEALGLTPPVLATMPHILGPDGQRKLSKRDGAKDVLDYIRQGYLPEALLNFIASLGWNDGTEQELFNAQQLIEKFSLERVQRSGARFDERRLQWMNGAHLREQICMTTEEQLAYSLGDNFVQKNFWPSEATADPAALLPIFKLVQERLKYFDELPELTRFFFADLPVDPTLITEHKQLKKLSKGDLKTMLEQAQATLQASDFTNADLTDRLNKLLEETGQKPAVLFSLIRIATTQAPASPGLAETLTVLGKEVSLRRLQQQL
ncbi:MAG TPA: glutamate--tRNA ligase, partial [Patescibacteria group bacterium]|nr:glutamate--tRNA ligase [Patescibacteria group bacterium]